MEIDDRKVIRKMIEVTVHSTDGKTTVVIVRKRKGWPRTTARYVVRRAYREALWWGGSPPRGWRITITGRGLVSNNVVVGDGDEIWVSTGGRRR